MSHAPSTIPPDPLFRCPVCGERLFPLERMLGCHNAHTFDVAREGYVNLLLAQHRRSRDPGYSRDMIVGRREFFDAGHFELLADRLAETASSFLPDARERVVLDAGCGEGYYLRRLREQLDRIGSDGGTLLGGLDISKHAIRVAAKRDPRGRYAVASVYRMPVLPSRVDVLLTHFSPLCPDEFRRVLRPGGVVVTGSPGEFHLFSLKELLYERPARHEPSDPLAGYGDLQLLGTERIRYDLALRGPGQVGNLLLMTPYYWSADQRTQAHLAQLDSLDTEVDVVVHAYRYCPTDGRAGGGREGC
jgi:23S rRNA (guanine745-N1)-methyltransferase